jgi:hypothetical protein
MTMHEAGLQRREGLRHSHLIEWRRARDAGAGTAAGTHAAAQPGPGGRGAALGPVPTPTHTTACLRCGMDQLATSDVQTS